MAVLLETIRGSSYPETGDQNLATYTSASAILSDGAIDIGTHMSDMATTPTSIDHLVIRVHADLVGDPGLQPLDYQLSMHQGPLGDAIIGQWGDHAGVPPPVDGWFEASVSLDPSGNPWTKAVVDDLDLSFSVFWDSQNPFPPNDPITLRIQEHEAQVWGTLPTVTVTGGTTYQYGFNESTVGVNMESHLEDVFEKRVRRDERRHGPFPS